MPWYDFYIGIGGRPVTTKIELKQVLAHKRQEQVVESYTPTLHTLTHNHCLSAKFGSVPFCVDPAQHSPSHIVGESYPLNISSASLFHALQWKY